MADLLVPRCGCNDCEAAVSPGAYLASLLDYALKHVRNNDMKIDLAFLEARLHQPFSDLPMDCEAMDRKVRQVRIAVEVLRDYVGARPLLEPVHETTLSKVEADYRLAAYTQLLTMLGTTYEEIRRTRSAVAADRTALAERLGIELTADPGGPRTDELDQLFLDIALPVGEPQALTERSLERTFGLGDTGRDPLSEGIKYGDPQQQITRWNFNGSYWNRNTDAEGLIYLDLFNLAIDSYAVRVFSDKTRGQVVASGERKTSKGAIRLVPENGSGLFGVVEIDYKADETDISLSVLPSMLVWRLRHLRTLWESQDWSTDLLVVDTIDLKPPLIDPQVINFSDLQSGRPGTAAFDLWLDRSNWLNNQRSLLRAARKAAATPLAGMEAIVMQALSMPGRAVTIANLEELQQAQLLGERIEQRLRPLALTPSAFTFLLRILGLTRNEQPIADIEWEIVDDTLLHARKQLEFTAWRTEEQSRKLTLSPNHFRVGDKTRAPEQATSLSMPLWLSTREARRNWIDVLEARIAQEATIIAGLESAVSSVEEATLPLLRDALIVAADSEGDLLSNRAEWLTQRLLIDFRMSGLQLTTRVAQAIETLQELLFSLRTGQLEQDTVSASAPLESICAVAQGDRRIDLFGRGEDDVLWHRIWDGRWRSWRSLGALPGARIGLRPSNPAVVAHANGRLDLVVRGSDRVIWHKRYEQKWSDWLRVEDDLELVGDPAVALRSPDQIDVFALRIGDLQVMQRHYDGTKWTAWEATGATSSRSPAATSWSGDRLDLFLGRRIPDLFKPLHRWWDGAVWQEEPLDKVFSNEPAAASWGIDRLDVFQNFGNHLWQKSWDGAAWQPWVDLDAALPVRAPKLQGVPSVYSRASGTLDVFALRSGNTESPVWRRRFVANAWSDWEVLPSDHLELVPPDFDAEWKWIGSYSTWRSAMFVSLYPDNLLLPSLITHQTPAFKALVEQTRPTRRLTPEDACEQARMYSSYLREVSSLEIQATCQVATDINKNEPCKTTTPVLKKLLYMFGRTDGKVYWSAINPDDRSGYAQSFWEKVPLAPKDGKAPASMVVNIIGALPWLNRNLGKHHIYLFLDTAESGIRKLKCICFDLDRYSYGSEAWTESLEFKNLPKHNGVEIAPHQLTILPVQSNSVVDPPQLALHDYFTGNVYVRSLNDNGDGWKGTEDDWASFEIVPRYGPLIGPERVSRLEATLRVNNVTWLIYVYNQSRRAYASISGQNSADIGDASSRFLGALPGVSADSSIFLFYEENDQTIYREVKKNAGPGTSAPGLGSAFIPTASLTALARDAGSFAPSFFVMPNKGGHSYAYRCTAVNGELIGSSKVDVVPVLKSVTNIPVGESMTALQGRRTSIKKVYLDNKGASASNLTYLAEAYRLVPLQLALNMQSSGEYVAALDWFMTVYDYRAPQGERYIDYGLEIDAGLPETQIYQHPEDWLLDPLNPHAIALTRRYAYTRFTIASIIRCLNDFADAEFTYDTNESLVRARLLYTTALELSDSPEMRQSLGVCEALIGALEIQPGEPVLPDIAAALGEIMEELTQGKVGSAPGGLIMLEKIKALVQSSKDWATILPELNAMKVEALKTVPVPFKTSAAISERPAMMANAYSGLLTDVRIEQIAKRAGEIAIAGLSKSDGRN